MTDQLAPIVTALRSAALFSSLPEETLQRIALQSRLEAKPAGAAIFAQGARAPFSSWPRAG